MSLPKELVDRVFDRLKGMYGSKFVEMWVHVSPEVTNETWASGLDGVSKDTLSAVLRHLLRNNPFPPTLPEFVALCHRLKGSQLPEHQPAPALPPPDNSAEAKAKREEAAARLKGMGRSEPNREWAQRALLRHQSKAYVLTPGALAIVERALK